MSEDSIMSEHTKTLNAGEIPQLNVSTPRLGQFAIEADSHSSSERSGASAIGPDDYESLDDVSSADPSTELPSIVWLRGDEPWFAEFDMEAADVMARLNIKRSRLTQLSGHELRVGRIRVDRYIKPLYRSKDVEEYHSWTRATASHQKSTAALKTAVSALEDQTQVIAGLIDESRTIFSDHITKKITETIEVTVSSLVDETVVARLKDLAESFHQHEEKLTSETMELRQEVSRSLNTTRDVIQAEFRLLDQRLDVTESHVAALALRTSELQDYVSRMLVRQTEVMTKIETLEETLAQVIQTKHQNKPLARLSSRPSRRSKPQPTVSSSTATKAPIKAHPRLVRLRGQRASRSLS